jgi:hypothetical protein
MCAKRRTTPSRGAPLVSTERAEKIRGSPGENPYIPFVRELGLRLLRQRSKITVGRKSVKTPGLHRRCCLSSSHQQIGPPEQPGAFSEHPPLAIRVPWFGRNTLTCYQLVCYEYYPDRMEPRDSSAGPACSRALKALLAIYDGLNEGLSALPPRDEPPPPDPDPPRSRCTPPCPRGRLSR